MTTSSASTPERANRLAREKSPYLLQHAHNPVDWYAWGEEAFERAEREVKPIFLSIGYSTCHWCHVMERESFEDETVGAFLNRHFVSIKVDREERPDVDRVYMSFVQATSGQGGWPLNVFLAPDRKPFFGGTYFPPDNRHGRPGFLEVLRHIQQLWDTRRDELRASATELHTRMGEALSSQSGTSAKEPEPDEDTLRQAAALFQSTFDPRHGGFGGAPKFPQPCVPSLLLRCGRRFGDRAAMQAVLHTCDRMAVGGIHDQLGGGFARYAVDAEWLVPHFEKMLYDNAQLAQLYLDAWLVSGEPRYADVVRDILAYVQQDMTDPEGGFYSAEDADSEGQEGKFYCWTRSELEKILTSVEFAVAVRYFGITEAGNFVDHSHPSPLPNLNVLSVVHPSLTDAERAALDSAKRKMLEVRNRRIRPHRDDKILTSWNGLMLGAFARAGAVLGEESYRAAAERNLKWIRARLWQPPAGSGVGTLFHRWRDGEHDRAQLLTAYAFLLSGVVDLYEATLQPEHLEFASALAKALLAKFYDVEQGGFWQSDAAASDLIFRVKDDHDGAEPSGNAVAALSLLKLGAITGRKEFTSAAEKTLRFYAERMRELPQALPAMLQALDFSLQEPKRVVVAANGRDPRANELLRAVDSVYQPNKVVLGNAGLVEEFSRALPAPDGPVVYLCSGTTCQPPTADPLQVKALLSGS